MVQEPETDTTQDGDRELHPVLLAFKKRPYIYSFVVGALALTLVRPCLVVEADKPTRGPKVETFAFTDHQGAEFKPSDLKGQVWLAGFFDPQAPTEESATFQAMRDIEERYVEEGLEIRLVLFSVALQDGTREKLAAIHRANSLDSKRWILLVPPDSDSLRQVAINIFRARYEAGEGKTLEHSDRLWIIDRDGFMRGHPRQGRDNYKTSVRNYDDIFEWSRVVMKERPPK